MKLQGTDGKILELKYNPNNLLPIIDRNGIELDRSQNYDLYISLCKDGTPFSLGWKQGKSQIRAGNFTFENMVRKE